MNTHCRRRNSRSRNTGRPSSSTQAISPSRTALSTLRCSAIHAARCGKPRNTLPLREITLQGFELGLLLQPQLFQFLSRKGFLGFLSPVFPAVVVRLSGEFANGAGLVRVELPDLSFLSDLAVFYKGVGEAQSV